MSTFSTMPECSAKITGLCDSAITACATLNFDHDYDRFCAQSSRIVFENVVCNKYFSDCQVSYEPGSFTENGQRYTYKVIIECKNTHSDCFGMQCTVLLGPHS